MNRQGYETRTGGRLVLRASAALMRFEHVLVGVFCSAMFGLVVIGMFARYGGHAIYWIDEAASFAMVLMTFAGASLVSRLKQDFAITLLVDYSPPHFAYGLRILCVVLSVLFAVSLIVLSWRILDPIELWRHDLDVGRFASATGNYVYTEMATTVPIPKYIFYLSIPMYAVFLLVHSLANLIDLLDSAGKPCATPGSVG